MRESISASLSHQRALSIFISPVDRLIFVQAFGSSTTRQWMSLLVEQADHHHAFSPSHLLNALRSIRSLFFLKVSLLTTSLSSPAKRAILRAAKSTNRSERFTK
jgi:hypothetical protein